MHFSLRQIEVFLTTTQTLNITHTAAILNMTVPAAWKQIHNLENLCEKKLFNRIGKKLTITPEGKLLSEKSKKLIQISTDLQDSINLIQKEKQAIINISIGNTFQSIIFEFLNPFIKKNETKVQFKLNIDACNTQLDYLHKEQHDFYFLADYANFDNLEYQSYELIKSDFIIACSSQHPLAQKKTLNETDFKDVQFLSNAQDIITRESYAVVNSLYKHFDKLKESWNNDKPVIHLDSFLSVREAVKANIGLAVLPRVIIKEELKTDLITILPYKDNIFENFSLKIIGAARKDKNISYMHEALKNYIIQSMKL